jgi:hypothetical protein
LIWALGVGVVALGYLVYAAAQRDNEEWDEIFPPGEYLTTRCLCRSGWRVDAERCDCGWFQ